MRYIKVLLIVLIFFMSLIFLFQNQAPLSEKIVLQLNLLVIPPMTSIELPYYVVVLGGFLVGAILTLLLLLWDRMRMTARVMRVNWRLQAMQNEERKLLEQMEKLAEAPATERPGLFARFKAEHLARKKARSTSAARAAAAVAEAKKEDKKGAAPTDAKGIEENEIAPDPDKQ